MASPNLALLLHVAHGQSKRTILDQSKYTYMTKVRVMTEILNRSEDIRIRTLMTDANKNALKYIGEAAKVYKLQLPMSSETAQLLFAAISIDDSLPKKRKSVLIPTATEHADIPDAEMPDAIIDLQNPGKNKVTVTAQTYQNYKSALKWWHAFDCPEMDKVGYPFPAETDAAITKAIATYKRDIGVKKRKGIMSQKEGKSKYSLYGLGIICKHFMGLRPIHHKHTWNEGLFASLFTKLSVSTIGRSDNIDDLLLSLIDWENDAMTVQFGTTKSDQTGETTSERKHIFANPFKPELCSILALAVYTWCKRRSPSSGCQKLFDGDEQNKRYYEILMIALKEIDAGIDLGCAREDIGTHSNRKFAESTSVSRIDGPNRTQVCLRSGQSVGRTQDCYMFQEDDGDCFVGRTVAQLKFDADEFDVLPCHFGPATLDELSLYGWENIIDGYSHYPPSFQRVIHFLLPCLVHHYYNGDLARLYPAGHPIFAQRIFTNQDLISSLKDKVIIKHGYCHETHMWAQGVPAVIMISREIRDFRSHYQSTCDKYDASFDGLRQVIDDRLQLLPQKIVDSIREQLVVEGAVQVTSSDIRRIVSELLDAPGGKMDAITSALAELSRTLTSFTSSNGRNSETDNPLQDQGTRIVTGGIHSWPGSQVIHTVPFGFLWPSYTANTMWNLWFLGDANRRIQPFKLINPKFDLTTLLCKSNRGRTKRILKKLIELAIAGNMISNERDITEMNMQSIYDYSYPLLLQTLYPTVPTRPEDININTSANRMPKNANRRSRHVREQTDSDENF